MKRPLTAFVFFFPTSGSFPGEWDLTLGWIISYPAHLYTGEITDLCFDGSFLESAAKNRGNNFCTQKTETVVHPKSIFFPSDWSAVPMNWALEPHPTLDPLDVTLLPSFRRISFQAETIVAWWRFFIFLGLDLVKCPSPAELKHKSH